MSRAEPEIPSIQTPLAHEQHIRAHHETQIAPGLDHEAIEHQQRHMREANDAQLTPDLSARRTPDGRRDDSAAVGSVLGPRPDRDDPRLQPWERAAAAIGRYRNQHNLPDREPALGAEPRAGNLQQRLDRSQAAAEVLDALYQLGRPVERQAPIARRIHRKPGLTREELERDNGWEP